jgi:hypothetical protein
MRAFSRRNAPEFCASLQSRTDFQITPPVEEPELPDRIAHNDKRKTKIKGSGTPTDA